jgi:hypothetical protein
MYEDGTIFLDSCPILMLTLSGGIAISPVASKTERQDFNLTATLDPLFTKVSDISLSASKGLAMGNRLRQDVAPICPTHDLNL